MSAWNIGQTSATQRLLDGATIQCLHAGPYLATIRITRAFQDSTISMDVSLAADSARLDFQLSIDWFERGRAEVGTPSLWIRFAHSINESTLTAECPNGTLTRETNGAVFVAQRWVDVTGSHTNASSPVGLTLLTESLYGYRVGDNCVMLGLLRSSYHPDPVPEMGTHTFRFSLLPHDGPWSASSATREAANINLPFSVINTTVHDGPFAPRQEMVKLVTPNICLGALKIAEDDDAMLIRLYEIDGIETVARVAFAESILPPHAIAATVDILEQPERTNTAAIINGELQVPVKAHGMVTVKISNHA
ncbi:MAG TPA: glycoside hydrolase family 38 C-terminal domain-containing protein, partial [Armatimonadota bacterium]|nr:glycoside hydrolase family 38 C-terminal domain-containing protein [Armatimonadota bacterium]